jgi:hypothetical protein
MKPINRLLLIFLSGLMLLAQQVSADVIVRFNPSNTTVYTGDTFNIDVIADISDPVLGWGLDLWHDPSFLSLPGSPIIGPLWQPAFAPDGDGLAALAFPNSISGNDILLATITFKAGQTIGGTDLILSITSGDLTEGFPLDPTGFDQATFMNGHVTILPEPASVVILLISGLLGMRRRRL